MAVQLHFLELLLVQLQLLLEPSRIRRSLFLLLLVPTRPLRRGQPHQVGVHKLQKLLLVVGYGLAWPHCSLPQVPSVGLPHLSHALLLQIRLGLIERRLLGLRFLRLLEPAVLFFDSLAEEFGLDLGGEGALCQLQIVSGLVAAVRLIPCCEHLLGEAAAVPSADVAARPAHAGYLGKVLGLVIVHLIEDLLRH